MSVNLHIAEWDVLENPEKAPTKVRKIPRHTGDVVSRSTLISIHRQ